MDHTPHNVKRELDRPLILASASPRREQLLRAMNLEFSVVPPRDTEELSDGLAPESLVVHNARLKAREVARQQPQAWVLGADTIVVRDGRIYGKPRDMTEAVQMLCSLAGQAHDVFTGVCLTHDAGNKEHVFSERTRVWMKPLTADQVTAYFNKVNPLDKAGAYAAQEHGDTIIDRIDGLFSNVMGLPVERLTGKLQPWCRVTSA